MIFLVVSAARDLHLCIQAALSYDFVLAIVLSLANALPASLACSATHGFRCISLRWTYRLRLLESYLSDGNHAAHRCQPCKNG